MHSIQAQLVGLDLQEIQVRQVRLAIQVQPVQLDSQVGRVIQVTQVHKVFKASKDLRMVQPVHRVFKDLKVSQEL